MRLTRRDFAAGIVAGIAAPHIITSARAQGSTIKIGMCVPVTGPAAEQGLWAQNGAKLALAAVNKAGGVLGKQVELVIEDDQTTNPGIVLAFSKLAAQSDIVAFLGSIRSTQVQAMAPDVLKLGKPVMIGGTDPDLTHMGNPWLFRFRPNDSYSGRVIADLRRQHARQEEVGDRAFDRRVRHRRRQGADRRAEEARRAAGARPGLRQPEPGLHAGRARDEAVRRRRARHLFHLRERPRHLRPPAAPARRQHSLGRLALGRDGLRRPSSRVPRCTAPMASPITRKIPARPRRRSASSTATPTRSRPTTRAPGPTTPSPSCRRRSTRPARPIPARSARRSWPSRNSPGAEGEYNFDQNGDGLHGYNVVKNDKGNIVFDKHIDFND